MWGSEPATEKQKATLEKLGVAVKEGLTKYEAAQLLDEALKKNPGANILKAGSAEKQTDKNAPPEKTTQKAEAEPDDDEDPDKPRLQIPKSTAAEAPPAPSPSPVPKIIMGVLVLAGLGVAGWLVSQNPALFQSKPESPPEPVPEKVNPTKPPPPAPVPNPAKPPEPVTKADVQTFANGQVSETGTLKQLPDGSWVKHGAWTNFWANGKINTWGEYQDGEKVGAWPFWMEDGREISTNRFRAKHGSSSR